MVTGYRCDRCQVALSFAQSALAGPQIRPVTGPAIDRAHRPCANRSGRCDRIRVPVMVSHTAARFQANLAHVHQTCRLDTPAGCGSDQRATDAIFRTLRLPSNGIFLSGSLATRSGAGRRQNDRLRTQTKDGKMSVLLGAARVNSSQRQAPLAVQAIDQYVCHTVGATHREQLLYLSLVGTIQLIDAVQL